MTVDDLVRSGEVPAPDLLKVDVEGAEGAVLQGAEETIDRHSPILFIATHGAARYEECEDLLEGWGYQTLKLSGDVILAHPEDWTR